jgi:hypothetical protein
MTSPCGWKTDCPERIGALIINVAAPDSSGTGWAPCPDFAVCAGSILTASSLFGNLGGSGFQFLGARLAAGTAEQPFGRRLLGAGQQRRQVGSEFGAFELDGIDADAAPGERADQGCDLLRPRLQHVQIQHHRPPGKIAWRVADPAIEPLQPVGNRRLRRQRESDEGAGAKTDGFVLQRGGEGHDQANPYSMVKGCPGNG